MALSGLKKCEEPSRWERNVTPFLGDLAQIVQAENLKAAGIGQNGTRPGHEPVQSSQLLYLCYPRPQVKVVGVAQQNLDTEFLEDVLRNAFDRGERADGHEHRRLDFAMRSGETATAGCTGLCLNLELKRHSPGLYRVERTLPSAWRRSNIKNASLGSHFAALDDQTSDAGRQAKSSRPGAPRIKVEHAVFRVLLGDVTVPVNHRRESRGLRLEIETLQVVQDVNRDAAGLKYVVRRNLARPLFAIHVATDCGYRGNFRQLASEWQDPQCHRRE